MPRIDPFVSLFVAVATLNAGMFVRLRADIAAVRGEIAGLREDVAGSGERLARVEGTVAGALGRPFPERMARAPGDDDNPGG